jgi:hypothetical protein
LTCNSTPSRAELRAEIWAIAGEFVRCTARGELVPQELVDRARAVALLVREAGDRAIGAELLELLAQLDGVLHAN